MPRRKPKKSQARKRKVPKVDMARAIRKIIRAHAKLRRELSGIPDILR